MTMQFGRKVAIALIGASTLMVAGCATETTYRPATGTGFYRTGYSDQQLEPDRFMVSFAGNTVTSRDTVERYLLFRAAQLTLANGYDYFVMADRDTQLRSRTYSTPGAYGPGFGGWGGGWWGPSWRYYGRGFGWRSWDPFWGDPFFGNNMDINTIDRYEATAEVVMRKGPIPRDNLRAFDARAIVNTIGPTVVMPK
jgi:hypothetical protein